MIIVTYGNNLNRTTSDPIPATTTLRAFCEENIPNYAAATLTLDGSALRPGDIDKTFADFGVTERCYLLSVVKADNA